MKMTHILLAALAAFLISACNDPVNPDPVPVTLSCSLLTDQTTGGTNDVYKIVRNNNFFGDLVRLDVDLVAIHVKKGSIDGIFIMENRDAEVLFS